MSAPEAHAKLSASGSHKWLHCPPSANLEAQLPETTSSYAEEGRLAHAIGELKLRKHFTPMGPKKFANELKKLQEMPHYSPEMLEHTDRYLEFVQAKAHSFSSPPYVVMERRLDYSHIAPEGFGTGDCLIIGGSVLVVIDLKYGQGVPVSAEANPQMMLYALGALKEYALLYAIDTVRLAIVQPRLGEPSEWEISAADLLAWGESIKPTAQAAFDGEGEFCSGEWCRFCRAKATCRARSNTMTALEAFGGMKPPLISNEEVGDILRRAQTLKSWVTDLEEYALSALLAGDEIPGWKAVEGRSNRQFADTDAAFKVLVDAGYNETLLYERRPITLTAVEKLTGKPKFTELLSGQVIKPPGKPTLAPESDHREAVTNKVTAEEAFGKAS
jgi:hypothetical protein